MKNLYTLIFLFVQVFVTNASAQGLHLGRERYTSTGFTVYNVNSGCYGSELKPYVNGNEMIGYNRGFCDFGICKFDFPFGTLNVGDVLTIRDQCGNTSNAVTIQDDYVYVEVPQGRSYPVSGI